MILPAPEAPGDDVRMRVARAFGEVASSNANAFVGFEGRRPCAPFRRGHVRRGPAWAPVSGARASWVRAIMRWPCWSA